MEPNRFDYVAYDAEAQIKQSDFKSLFGAVEILANKHLPDSRWKSLLMTNLEYAYMCTGKAIRDDQIIRNGSADLQEGRSRE